MAKRSGEQKPKRSHNEVKPLMSSLPSNGFEQEPRRVMAYCHDSVGVGHLRRTMAICERIGRLDPDTSFLLATGTPYVPLFDPVPHVDYLKLPALTKTKDGEYGCKYLNMTLARMIRCRESILLHAAAHFEPGVLLVDKAPLGVCRELVPTLRWLRRQRPNTRIIFGMRDIEDEPEAAIRQWNRDGVVEMLERCFDEVWVYGIPEVFNPIAEYRLPASIEAKTKFMGYVSRGVDQTLCGRASAHEILVTVGGGTDGELLLRTYLAQAAERAHAMGFTSTLIGGPDLPPEAAQRLCRQSRRTPGVEWVDHEPSLGKRIARARLVVCMGGYNTLCEAAAYRRPMLVVPRVRPRLEQAIRSQCWARRGAVIVLHPNELSPASLADRAIDLLTNGPESTHPELDLRGLDRIAERFQAIWHQEPCHATPVCV